MKTTLLLIVSILISLNLKGAVVTVPGAFSSIQEAIDASSNGDTIVVAPGTYYENINFRGKNVMLTSMFYMAADTGYISTTIINGSNPVFADTASCIIFNSFEDSTAILQGFTITGGGGTRWLDIHGAGIYREGGGILIEFSSPTIRNNIITGNLVTDMSGVASTGGGGIRVGDGDPTIINNFIGLNQARYGAGIVLNYTGCKIRNNVISSNTGGQDFYGGSAIWINNNLPGTPKIIENNTIVDNNALASNGTGGISIWSATNVVLKNNIIYGNYPVVQIKTISSVPQVSYCNIEGGYTGIGNIYADPLFTPDRYLLQPGSPCIDAGDTLSVYNDLEISGNPGNALFPSNAGLRNDMGAYGGPGAWLFPEFGTTVGVQELDAAKDVILFPNPAREITSIVFESELYNATLTIHDASGRLCTNREHISGKKIEIETGNLPEGIYLLTIRQDQQQLYNGKLIINSQVR